MIVARTVVRALKETPRQGESIGLDSTARNLRRVLLIGVDRFSATTIKLTDQQTPARFRWSPRWTRARRCLGEASEALKSSGASRIWPPSWMNTRFMASTSTKSGYPTTPRP